MNKPFGIKSQALLKQAHPDLQRLFNRVNEIVQCTILSTGRTIAQQADFVNATNLTGVNPEQKKLSWTMNSKHVIQPDGYAHAVDAAPDLNNQPDYNDLDLAYFSGIVMGVAQEMGVRIRCGCDFGRDGIVSNETKIDRDHFELEQ